MVLVEDRIEMPADATPFEVEGLDFDSRYQERCYPITTLGYGAADKFYKTLNLHHCLALEGGSWSNICKLRSEVFRAPELATRHLSMPGFSGCPG